ncbi:MAG: crossover junction endodeoxyribonuclease RuvC, partial [Planctomycetes bacterium]|nr:crossover junction endodeoxyribonuclease RuvC [Planctomycetota bacterium]
MRVIGIDPGTRDVGYAIVEGQGSRLTLCESGTISCNGKDKLANRLVQIHRELLVVMRKWQPEAAAVENVFTGKNPLTAIKIGEGRGVALLSAA